MDEPYETCGHVFIADQRFVGAAVGENSIVATGGVSRTADHRRRRATGEETDVLAGGSDETVAAGRAIMVDIG